ncbi:MAG: phosphoethanolamine--lipid A transferase [Sulfitobacter sp.]|jgi:lipid A ethanolaminephosphotransferase|uniref:phosphoethanolamine transferase n=1 Tax=Sulfitobacter sp. TaxID=1903071 RepID=UPI000C0F6106|nr:phosphatidylethanolamine--Kdo2-lipid A phosphoethanolamine transferase [Roseobacter sp.]MBV48942.1 phosphatidylethanolamine--Kdo2-lipid A phosphoethanolamine transferase [Roseobacter sp.]PHR10201.1 MAG: phosphatidylethanolamine--Kdo2-lipid A phosphoethanolamine transferase [Sulfitobacter sp.]|tara:strand:+ start:3565 stop:5235 length:1671 start_codon:yes stop_codon:yes gene_type:complete
MSILSTVFLRLTALKNALPLSPLTLTALTLVFIFIVDNSTFWSIAIAIFSGHLVSLAVYILAVFCLMLAAFSLFAFPWTVKPFLAFMLILSSITSYYMDNLGVVIDRDMIQNVMVTTFTESKHLITLSFVLRVLIAGVLPALVVFAVKLKPQGKVKAALLPVVSFVLSLALAAGLLMTDMKSYASILRERKDFMSAFQPGMPLVSTIRYAKMMSRSANTTMASIGTDAKKGPAYAQGDKPVLTIVVAGETARTQNFSLNGYGVDTNPNLEKLPVISFSQVSSCGTATAVSLPCMFSKFDRGDYSYEKGVSTENVLDVMKHAGFKVEWWDNNTGDKGLAARIPSRSFTNTDNQQFCPTGECDDGIFMQALKDYAASITEDTVLVMHQIGSHGPTYYLRYPPEFERFTPACRTAEFKNCTPQEIVNVYDNSIAYTDAILAQTIEFLQSQDQLTTSLLYVSDHGESLGEGGLYLHGSPYFMAPDVQTKVPMILWMSNAFSDKFNIDRSCIASKKTDTLSHDNLFHSLLGMLDIDTSERNASLDIFASCKGSKKVVQIDR